jgi:hypothetical protein
MPFINTNVGKLKFSTSNFWFWSWSKQEILTIIKIWGSYGCWDVPHGTDERAVKPCIALSVVGGEKKQIRLVVVVYTCCTNISRKRGLTTWKTLGFWPSSWQKKVMWSCGPFLDLRTFWLFCKNKTSNKLKLFLESWFMHADMSIHVHYLTVLKSLFHFCFSCYYFCCCHT